MKWYKEEYKIEERGGKFLIYFRNWFPIIGWRSWKPYKIGVIKENIRFDPEWNSEYSVFTMDEEDLIFNTLQEAEEWMINNKK